MAWRGSSRSERVVARMPEPYRGWRAAENEYTFAVHLPLLNPYLKSLADFTHGVNFAVAGSTALDTSSIAKWNIISPLTNSSLNVQLQWFRTHLSTICNSKTGCGQRLEMALFLMGEIGGFDVGSIQKACCGIGGDYDFDLTRFCGAPRVLVCRNPERRVSWDGIHLTQEAYKHMAEWLIRDIMPKIHCIV
ncbi:hypothetical protein HHK36_017873 [Tetracentron sinense]|uniref:Uncharacterized protein n=1 Tax=Tetracentron sinense TaxID=13715 RepID=A0A835D9T5_TETSI|nr:hypothetical protein HHK36_017873 [Tetracentron sinense]